jgi:hypothetical protein
MRIRNVGSKVLEVHCKGMLLFLPPGKEVNEVELDPVYLRPADLDVVHDLTEVTSSRPSLQQLNG